MLRNLIADYFASGYSAGQASQVFMNKYRGVVKLLKDGAVGHLPSDTIYGLSCVALNERAVERIYQLKGRDYDKPFIILLTSVEQAAQLGVNPKDLGPVKDLWPAPLTAITRAGQKTPELLHRGTYTLALRVPDNAELRKLISRTGPLVSTSANPQGQEPAKTLEQAKKYFGDKLDFYIDAGDLKIQPSTMVQIQNGGLKIVRQGAYEVPANKLY